MAQLYVVQLLHLATKLQSTSILCTAKRVGSRHRLYTYQNQKKRISFGNLPVLLSITEHIKRDNGLLH